MSRSDVSRFPLATGWVGLLVLMFGGGLWAEEAPKATLAVPSEEEIARRIADLDHERFAVREGARQELLATGRPALPLLLDAAKSDSPEKRIRAVQLVDAIRSGILQQEFKALGELPEAQIDVEHGMWLIAMILDPGLPKAPLTVKLDEMAAAVREAAGKGREPGKLPPVEAMTLLTGVLKDEFGLLGDVGTYNSPDNSSIHRVIVRKKGLPILLSEIAVAVARRVGIPVVGLAIPGRYMIKYDGARAPEGEARTDIIVNPFEGWRVTNAAELGHDIPGFDLVTHLDASSPRATLVRMLNNLSSDLMGQGNLKQAREIREYQLLLMPDLLQLP